MNRINPQLNLLWRDAGYAFGELLSGILADALRIPFAMLAIAALTFISGVIVSAVIVETLPETNAAIHSVKSERIESGIEAKQER